MTRITPLPNSTLAALNLLDELEGRKVAVLGDMLELGMYEIEGHEMVGAARCTGGRLAHHSRRASQDHCFRSIAGGFPRPGAHWHYPMCPQVIDYLKENLEKGDVVLVKGSHGMHMERIVSALEARS